MASKKQHAAIDFQGVAKITVAGAAGTSGQVLTSGGSGAMTWGSGGGGGSYHKVTVTWIDDDTTPPSGLAFSDGGNAADGHTYDTVQITHGLGTRDVLVDVIEFYENTGGGDSYYNEQYAGLDLGHAAHVLVVRNGVNTVKLIFPSDNNVGAQYRVLIQKVG